MLATKKSPFAGPGRGPTRFGYDAITQRGKRQAPTALLQSQDAEAPPLQRQKLVTGGRNLVQNFAIAAWMVRQHLNYVSTFSFQSKTGNADRDTAIEKLVNEVWSKRENCDIAGRHSLSKVIRLAEARRTVDGDVGLIKLRDGRLQPLEGDRIRTPGAIPENIPSGFIVHGVYVDKAGKAKSYAVCNRGVQAISALGGANTFIFERMVPAENLYLHAHYERFDQVRGVSPLASAMNALRDTYEGFDYALAKIKISQLFGLAITRSAAEPLGETYEPELDEEGNTTGRYKVDFGSGPVLLELDPGDEAKFLECNSPATETQAFFETMIQVALKSLDIPFSFYNESFTNYSGSRGAFLQYEQSAEIKRRDIRDMLDYLTAWRLGLFIQDGLLPGVTLDDLRWEWVHRGLPWLDPLKEVQAEVQSMDALLDNAEDIAQRHGKNFFANVDKQAACIAYAAKMGVPFLAGSISHAPAQNIVSEDQPGGTKPGKAK